MIEINGTRMTCWHLGELIGSAVKITPDRWQVADKMLTFNGAISALTMIEQQHENGN